LLNKIEEQWDLDIRKKANSLFWVIYLKMCGAIELVAFIGEEEILWFYKTNHLGPLWFYSLLFIYHLYCFWQLSGVYHRCIPQPLFYMAGLQNLNYLPIVNKNQYRI
jgi:hypothetical protein